MSSLGKRQSRAAKNSPARKRMGSTGGTTKGPNVVYTIGHSTRELETFLDLLQSHGVKQLVDVRTVPRSRKNPQYNKDSLPQALRPAGVRYVHLAALGGLRHAARDSINTGWHNASFRGFADYMQTPEFQRGLERLIDLASKRSTAIMCAEAVPWRCHRSLIADALTVRGIPVLHIFTTKRAQEHTLTPFIRVDAGNIMYPAEPAGLRGCEFVARTAASAVRGLRLTRKTLEETLRCGFT